jgi:hypothetical protein
MPSAFTVIAKILKFVWNTTKEVKQKNRDRNTEWRT